MTSKKKLKLKKKKNYKFFVNYFFKFKKPYVRWKKIHSEKKARKNLPLEKLTITYIIFLKDSSLYYYFLSRHSSSLSRQFLSVNFSNWSCGQFIRIIDNERISHLRVKGSSWKMSLVYLLPISCFLIFQVTFILT